MRVSILGLMVVGGLCASACQTHELNGFMPRQFVGATTEQVMAVYGEPVTIQTLADGRELHVYETVSLEDWRRLDPQALRAAGGTDEPRRHVMVDHQRTDDGTVLYTRRTTFSGRPNPSQAPVLCTIEVISGADRVVQSVSVASDLCLTIRS